MQNQCIATYFGRCPLTKPNTSVTLGPFFVQGVQVSNADGCYATFAVESFGSLKRIMKSTATTTA